MIQPLVSIGIPVYNAERFLREALDDLVGQTYANCDIIISDNASTDGTASICREYASSHPNIRYFRQSDNIGAQANFTFVLKQATGEFFMWAAGDDRCEPDLVAKLVQVLTAHAEVVCAMTDVLNIDDSGRPLFSSELANIRVGDVQRRWRRIRLRFFANPTSYIYFCIYGLFRTDVLRRVSLNYRGLVRYAAGSEIPILAQTAVLGRVVSIPGDLKIYRRHEASVFHTEQQRMHRWTRLDNHFNISRCLIEIALRSRLGAYDVACSLLVVVYTGFFRSWKMLIRCVIPR